MIVVTVLAGKSASAFGLWTTHSVRAPQRSRQAAENGLWTAANDDAVEVSAGPMLHKTCLICGDADRLSTVVHSSQIATRSRQGRTFATSALAPIAVTRRALVRCPTCRSPRPEASACTQDTA